MKTRRNLFLGSLVVIAFGAVSSALADFNQTGAGPYDYNDPANWASATIDGTWASGLTLTAAQRATFAADTVLATGLTFNYAGNFALTLDAAAAGTNTLTLGGDITLNTSGGTTANVLIGGAANHLNVNLGGVTRTMSVAASRTLTLHDVVSNGGITKTGTGTLRLNGVNTLGDVAVNDGTLFTEKGMTFGNLAVASAKTFQFGAQDAAYTIQINGLSGAGTVTTAGSGGFQRNLTLGNNDATAEFSGVITQSSNRALVLTKTGIGTQTLSGAAANTQGGGTGVGFDTYVSAGSLVLNKTAAIALPGDVFINGGTLQLSGTGDNQIADTAAVNWSSGTFDLNGHSETVGALPISVLGASANPINVAAGNTFTAAGNVNIFNSAATTLGTSVTFNPAGAIPTSTFAVTGASSFIFGQDSTTASTTRTNTLDLRNLGVFNAGTSGTALTNFVVGNYVQATGTNYNNGGINTAYLAPGSTIYSTAFGVGDRGTGSQPGQFNNTLYLGTGTTALHATTITVGEVGAIGTTGSTIKWDTGVTGGSLTLNGTGATSAVTNMYVGYKTDTASASAGTRLGTVDLSNGTLTGEITNLYVGYKPGSDSGTSSPATTGVFKIGAGAAGASSNLTIGNLTLAHSGQTVSNRNNPVNGTFQLDGGTVSVTNHIVLTNENAYDQRNGTLTINGGAMTVGGDITCGITRTSSTLTLSGGTLDMTGGSIGTATNPIDTFTINPATAATLKNVGPINGTAGITMTGAGTLTLQGTNTYIGNTTVSTGSLELAASTAAMKFAPGANNVSNKVTGAGTATFKGIFNIDLTNAAVADNNSWVLADVASKSFDPTTFSVAGFTELPEGTWKLVAGSKTWTFTQSDATLRLDVLPGYANWLSLHPTISDPAPGADPESDGIENVLEYVFSGNPMDSDPSILPDLNVTATSFVFTFNRLDDSETDTTQTFQYGTSLSGWSEVIIGAASSGPDGNGVTVGVVENGSAPDTITVTVPKSSNTTLFGRLQAVKLP